nr:beta-barrel assembly-enhancing protease [uncultured bacterium]
MRYRALARLVCSAMFLLVTGVYAQTEAPAFPNPGKTSMSRDQQHALGMQAASQVFQQMPVLPDDSAEALYVRQLGQKLVATIPEQYSWPFEFHVVPQKEINAFALPGGQMFVNIGTITAAKNEAELAGVMGHEMAHVYMQHSAKQAGKAQTTSTVAGIASVLLGATGVGNKAGGLVGQLGQMGIQMGAEGFMMKFSRTDESQADAVGTVILYKAGYNPQAMADFFKTLASQGGQAPPQLFSDHPNPGNRQEAISTQIAHWPSENYVGDSAAFTQVRQHASKVKAYTGQEIQAGAKSGQWAALNQRNGAGLSSAGASSFPTRASASSTLSPSAVSLRNVLPTDRMLNANLGPMKITHPENWPVALPEQRGQFVTIAPAEGITNSGVGYGVLLNGAAAPPQRMSIDDMTAALIQQIGQSNEMEQLGKPEAITVGGKEARSTVLRSPSPFPDANGEAQPERDWLVTVPQADGSMVFMIFIAPEADFAQLKPTYEAMLKSIQFR